MVETGTTARAMKTEQGGGEGGGAGGLFLPPGFRFYPTDDEVISSYLVKKFIDPNFTSLPIGEADLNKCEPWDLPSMATMGEKEWYFFCHKDMKYPTGMRTNRATKEGYWKATGKDREIFTGGKRHADDEQPVGMKKTLVFYMGRAPRGTKTNWVMHEFRIHGSYHKDNPNLRVNPKDEWVVCKVFHKNGDEGNNRQAQVPAAAVESSAGTPYNVSSVEAGDGGGGGDDDDLFQLDSIIDTASMYFDDDDDSTSILPAANMAIAINNDNNNNLNAVPYSAAYPVSTTNVVASTTTMTTASAAATFQLPNYSLINTGSSSTAAAALYVSSWNNMPPPVVAGRASAAAANGVGSYNLLQQQPMELEAMVKALGTVIGVPGTSSSSSRPATGAPQQNLPGIPQQKPQNYGDGHPYTWE
ncbi:hypothetical protein GUJ93_ZPchr0009g234 [Zizania palustris]|uniref:NAC domain-containing protein n=1 Tax=Zizania palustris TaxID=103762 RepID=A0A8J5R408_ZIZPA|nr:hypothetical protein GUJ93_ZPchr0009g234 [Zizania palustris]